MAVKCPKHNAYLEIEYTSIDMLGNRYPVVTGQCPKCKIKYLSREIMSCNGSFKIAGQAYEYLNEMEMAYPHPFKTTDYKIKTFVEEVSNDTAVISTNIKATKEQNKHQQRIDAQNRQQREYAEKRRIKEAQAAQKAKDARKRQMDARDAAVLEVRQRNAQGLNKSYHATKLCYLPAIPKQCPNDGEQLDYVKKVVFETLSTSMKKSAWCCFRCRTAFFLESERNEITDKLNKAQIKQFQKSNIHPIVVHSPKEESASINLSIPENTLYVCKGLISCTHKAHSVEAATGVLLGKNGAILKINTNYCTQCRKYFIGYDEYQQYRKLYGILLGNIKVTNGSFMGSETDLAEESILHMCGYSVNQTDNLSPAVRQSILQYLIDSKISNKPEIIDYLNFFIKRNGKRQNMEEAIRRWNEDLKWVREYQINRQRHFEIANIQKNK